MLRLSTKFTITPHTHEPWISYELPSILSYCTIAHLVERVESCLVADLQTNMATSSKHVETKRMTPIGEMYYVMAARIPAKRLVQFPRPFRETQTDFILKFSFKNFASKYRFISIFG
jgi:hypothetical protein